MTTLLPNTANTLCVTAANRWLHCLGQAREKRLRSVTWVSFGHDDFNKLAQCVMCQYFHMVCAHSRDSGEDCPSRFSSCAWCNHGLQLLETVQCEAGPMGQSVGSRTAGGLRMNGNDCETSRLCCRDVCGCRARWIIKKVRIIILLFWVALLFSYQGLSWIWFTVALRQYYHADKWDIA